MQVTDEEARRALSQTAVIKLNGGLGTGMGMTGAKSALEVRDGLTFLDIIALQVIALRERWGVELPLVLMNSFRTSEESLKILSKYDSLAVDGLPLDFIQNAEPKLEPGTLMPVTWPADPELEWCPPGHGDVYVSLVTSGVLDSLLEKGIRFAFLSNSDNLGATCDPDVAAWMVEHDLPFVAEVCRRTKSDRKGGHLAVRKADGRLILRDTAMVEDGEERYFRDIQRHSTFNANNVWINLEVLRERMTAREGVLGLPIIVNHKNVDPADPSSPEVVQMESAMGTAIEVFEGSEAILVPRTRFRPVKTTNDLLVIRSDFFSLDDSYHVVASNDRPGALRRPRLRLPLRAGLRAALPARRALDEGLHEPARHRRPRLRQGRAPRRRRAHRRVQAGARQRRARGAEPARSRPAQPRARPDTRTVDEHLRTILTSLEPAPTVPIPLTESLGPRRRPRRAGQGQPPGLRQLLDGRVCRRVRLARRGRRAAGAAAHRRRGRGRRRPDASGSARARRPAS